MTRLATTYGILDRPEARVLTMIPIPPFTTTLFRRDRIIEDYGGGHVSIPNDDEPLVPEEPGRRGRRRRERVPQDPPVIPVEEELPMDWYNVEMRRYQDDIGWGVNFVNESFTCLFEQMHSTPRPRFPYISSWDESVQARGNQVSGSGAGGDEDEEED